MLAIVCEPWCSVLSLGKVWCDVALQCSLSLLLCAVVVGGGVEGKSMGYSPWHCKIYNNNERRLAVIVHHLVATSPRVMWHLDSVIARSVMGGGDLLTLARCCVFLFVGAHCR